MTIQTPRVRPRLRDAATAATLLSAVMLVLNIGALPTAGALPAGASPAVPGIRINVTSGSTATTFNMSFVTGTSGPNNVCPGDSASGGYRWNTFLVPGSVDAGALNYNASGPVAPSGVAFAQPLVSSVGATVINRNTAPSTAVVIGIPVLSFSAFQFLPGGIPPGAYKMGIACTLGGVTEKFWELPISFASTGPADFTWTMAAPVASTTTTTAAPTTTLTPVATTVSGTTLVPPTSTSVPPATTFPPFANPPTTLPGVSATTVPVGPTTTTTDGTSTATTTTTSLSSTVSTITLLPIPTSTAVSVASSVLAAATTTTTSPSATLTTTTTASTTTAAAPTTTTIARSTSTTAAATTTTTTTAFTTTTIVGSGGVTTTTTTTTASSSFAPVVSSNSASGGFTSLPVTGTNRTMGIVLWSVLLMVFGRIEVLLSRPAATTKA